MQWGVRQKWRPADKGMLCVCRNGVFCGLYLSSFKQEKRNRKRKTNATRPRALGMSDPGVEPLEILEILELETPPYPRPPCRCPPCRLVR